MVAEAALQMARGGILTPREASDILTDIETGPTDWHHLALIDARYVDEQQWRTFKKIGVQPSSEWLSYGNAR